MGVSKWRRLSVSNAVGATYNITSRAARLGHIVVNRTFNQAAYLHVYDYSQNFSQRGFNTGGGVMHKFYVPTDTDTKTPGTLKSGAHVAEGIFLDITGGCDITVVWE